MTTNLDYRDVPERYVTEDGMDGQGIFLFLLAMVYDWVKSGSTRSIRYIYANDFSRLDDPPKLPKGKKVRVTLEYVEDD